MWDGSMRDRCRVDEGWIGEGSMCAGCGVDIGSIMSKKERRESENLFFLKKELVCRSPHYYARFAHQEPVSQNWYNLLDNESGRELALIPRNMNQLMMNTFLTIDKKYN